MDDERFDDLVRRLDSGLTRRGAVGSVLGGLAALVSLELTAAKNGKGKGKKARGKARQPAGRLHDPNAQCRHETGIFCSDTEPAPGHTCCTPNYVCTDNTCQCAPHYIECGAAESNTAEVVAAGHACIHESHCCTDGQPGCPEGQECTADTNGEAIANGQYHCVPTPECVPVGGDCNVHHPCCHLDQYHCSSTTTETGTCVANEPECVAVDKPCNTFHPCCHPDQYVCSSTTEAEGTCEKIDTCIPKTCHELGFQCGKHKDNCGDPIDCGHCPGGETCDKDGICRECHRDPKSCKDKPCDAVDNCGHFCGCDDEDGVCCSDGICRVPPTCSPNGESGLCCSGHQCGGGVCCAAGNSLASAIVVDVDVFNTVTVNTPPTTITVTITPGSTTPAPGGGGRRRKRRRRKHHRRRKH